MTTNTTNTKTSIATKGRESHRKTIFSILGVALLMSILFAGFAQAADNNNALVSVLMEDKIPTSHIVNCQSEKGGFPPLVVDCPHSGGYGYSEKLDREACVSNYGTSVTRVIAGICLAR